MIIGRGYISGRHETVLAEWWTPTTFRLWQMRPTPGWWLVFRHAKMNTYKRFSALHALKDLDVTIAYRGGVEKGTMVVDVEMPIYQGTFISLVCYGREGFTAAVKDVERQGKYYVLSVVGLRDWMKDVKITRQELKGAIAPGATDEVDIKFEGTVSFKKVLEVINIEGTAVLEDGTTTTDFSYNVGEGASAAECFDIFSLFCGQGLKNYNVQQEKWDTHKINTHTWWWAGDGRVKIAPAKHKRAVGDKDCVITDCKFEDKGFYNALLLEHEHEELSGAGKTEKVIVRGTQYHKNPLSIAMFGLHQKKIKLNVKITNEWEAIAADIVAKTSIPPFAVKMQNLEVDDFAPMHMTISGVRDYKRFVVEAPILKTDNTIGSVLPVESFYDNTVYYKGTFEELKKFVFFQLPPIYGEAIFWFTGDSSALIGPVKFVGNEWKNIVKHPIVKPPGARMYSLPIKMHQLKSSTWAMEFDEVKYAETPIKLMMIEIPYKRCTMPSNVTAEYIKNAMMADDVKIKMTPYPGGMRLTASELTARTSKIDDIEKYLRRAVVLGAGII